MGFQVESRLGDLEISEVGDFGSEAFTSPLRADAAGTTPRGCWTATSDVTHKQNCSMAQTAWDGYSFSSSAHLGHNLRLLSRHRRIKGPWSLPRFLRFGMIWTRTYPVLMDFDTLISQLRVLLVLLPQDRRNHSDRSHSAATDRSVPGSRGSGRSPAGSDPETPHKGARIG